MNKRYEALIIIDAGLDEDGINKIIEKLETLITDSENGEMIKLDRWGKKRLAYQINRKQFGYYVLFEFLSPPTVPLEFERICRFDQGVVRTMIVVIPDIVLKLKDREQELKENQAKRRAGEISGKRNGQNQEKESDSDAREKTDDSSIGDDSSKDEEEKQDPSSENEEKQGTDNSEQ